MFIRVIRVQKDLITAIPNEPIRNGVHFKLTRFRVQRILSASVRSSYRGITRSSRILSGRFFDAFESLNPIFCLAQPLRCLIETRELLQTLHGLHTFLSSTMSKQELF